MSSSQTQSHRKLDFFFKTPRKNPKLRKEFPHVCFTEWVNVAQVVYLISFRMQKTASLLYVSTTNSSKTIAASTTSPFAKRITSHATTHLWRWVTWSTFAAGMSERASERANVHGLLRYAECAIQTLKIICWNVRNCAGVLISPRGVVGIMKLLTYFTWSSRLW